MNVFIRAIVRIFSLGERLIIASLNGTIFHLMKIFFTIALINIHYLYTIGLHNINAHKDEEATFSDTRKRTHKRTHKRLRNGGNFG